MEKQRDNEKELGPWSFAASPPVHLPCQEQLPGARPTFLLTKVCTMGFPSTPVGLSSWPWSSQGLSGALASCPTHPWRDMWQREQPAWLTRSSQSPLPELETAVTLLFLPDFPPYRTLISHTPIRPAPRGLGSRLLLMVGWWFSHHQSQTRTP